MIESYPAFFTQQGTIMDINSLPAGKYEMIISESDGHCDVFDQNGNQIYFEDIEGVDGGKMN